MYIDDEKVSCHSISPNSELNCLIIQSRGITWHDMVTKYAGAEGVFPGEPAVTFVPLPCGTIAGQASQVEIHLVASFEQPKIICELRHM